MPSFLNPIAAAIAAAVAVPLLLVLYFLKLRRRELDVSSTLLWRKAIQDLQVNAPFQRLRRNLLLLLQLLLLLALIFALSRPVVNHTASAGRLSVILIDRSASMSATDMPGGRSRLDEAKKKASELVDSLPRGAMAMVIAFDDGADVVQAFTTDPVLLKNAIDSIKPTQQGSSLRTAYQLAEARSLAFFSDQLRTEKEGPEIWLYSDGRISDRDALALKSARLREMVVIGSDKAANIGIVALAAKRNFDRPNELQVFARLVNYGPEIAETAIQLSVDGAITPGGVRRGVKLLPERWSEEQRKVAEKQDRTIGNGGVEFNIDLPRGAVVKVELKELKDDVLLADDSAQIVVPPPRSLNVLLVSRKGNFWLERFVQSAGLRNPGQMVPDAYEEKMKDAQGLAREYDVIIFDRYQPRGLPPAGNFIFFNAVPPFSKLKVVEDAQGVVTLKDQAVLDWDRSHPLLKNLNLRFDCLETLKLEVPVEAQTLIEGKRGPLLVLYREGRHTHLVLPFDVQETNWPTKPSFPVFLDNCLQFLALGSDMDVRQSYRPGTAIRIPRFSLQAAGANLKSIRVTGPGDFSPVEVPIPDAGDFALPALPKVGVYTLDPPVPQYEKIAVNLLDENESNVLPVNKAPGGANGGAEVVQAGASGKSRMELWWWLVAAGAIPLCLIEWWVYTRRVHL
ncbi:MAG: VWA domain-containing protein [Tepidisphaeraceae bacterium]